MNRTHPTQIEWDELEEVDEPLFRSFWQTWNILLAANTEIEQERNQYRAALVGLVGEDDPKTLRAMADFLKRFPGRAEERNAVLALLGDAE